MKKIGIRILGCMALLSMVGCGRIEGASVQDLSNTKDAIVESETTLAENNNEYSLMDAIEILRSDEFKEYVFKVGIPISGKSVRITSKDVESYMF